MALRAVKRIDHDEYLIYNQDQELTHTMKRDPARKGEWVLRTVDEVEIDADRYRHDLFQRRGIAY